MFNSSGHLKTELELRDEYKAIGKPKSRKGPKSELMPCLQEIKGLANPPRGVLDTMSAVMRLMGETSKQADSWKVIKKSVGNPVMFMSRLESVDPGMVTKEQAKYVKDKLSPYSVEIIMK